MRDSSSFQSAGNIQVKCKYQKKNMLIHSTEIEILPLKKADRK